MPTTSQVTASEKPPSTSVADSTSLVAEKNQRSADNVWWFCLSAAFVVFLITVFVVALVMTSGVSANDCVDCNGEDISSRSGSPGYSSAVPSSPYTPATGKSNNAHMTEKPNLTILSSAEGDTSHTMSSLSSDGDVSDASSMESTSDVTDSSEMPTTVNPALKPLPPGSLLCTLSSGFNKSTYAFPPDGLCAIITFNSLVTVEDGTLTPPYNDDFTYFLETAKSHQTTEYGIGIDHKVCRNFSAMEALAAHNSTKPELEALWDQRIYHYGQVNTPLRFNRGDADTFVEHSARGLQVFSTMIHKKRDESNRPSYVILHFPVYSEQWAVKTANMLRGYSIDVFVAIGHHADTDSLYTRCNMVPPTILSEGLLKRDLLRSEYPVRLARTLASLASKASLWPSTYSFAVTLGIEGRWYRPKSPDTTTGIPGNYSLGKRCAMTTPPSGQLGSISEVCKNPNYNSTFYFDKKFKALVAYNKTERWLFTYDSALALRLKLCEANLNALSLKYSLAAVNIEFEDAKDDCGFGPFHRLQQLKALAAFLSNNYTSPASESACRSLT